MNITKKKRYLEEYMEAVDPNNFYIEIVYTDPYFNTTRIDFVNKVDEYINISFTFDDKGIYLMIIDSTIPIAALEIRSFLKEMSFQTHQKFWYKFLKAHQNNTQLAPYRLRLLFEG